MKYLIIAVLGVVLITACKKSEDGPTITEILSSSKWQLKQLTLEAPLGSLPADITLTTFKPCELDDVIEFKTGGSFSCVENKNICAAGTNNGLMYSLNGGTWALSNGDSVLTIVKGFNQPGFRFSKKTTTEVQLYQQQKNYLDQLVRYTYVLKAVE